MLAEHYTTENRFFVLLADIYALEYIASEECYEYEAQFVDYASLPLSIQSKLHSAQVNDAAAAIIQSTGNDIDDYTINFTTMHPDKDMGKFRTI